MGASLAYHLAADTAFGGSVLLIEKDPSFAFAATALSAGSIRQQFSSAINIAISPLFAEILNIPFTGRNLCVAGNATLSDGALHLVYATEAHRQAMLDWLDAGAHPAARPALPTMRVKAFSIKWADGPLRMDDELLVKTRAARR